MKGVKISVYSCALVVRNLWLGVATRSSSIPALQSNRSAGRVNTPGAFFFLVMGLGSIRVSRVGRCVLATTYFDLGKFAKAGRLRQHPGRARSPDPCDPESTTTSYTDITNSLSVIPSEVEDL